MHPRLSHVLALLVGVVAVAGCNGTAPPAEVPPNMVKVPIGSYKVGLAMKDIKNSKEFWIDKYEVTNDAYAEFLNSPEGQSLQPPQHWKGKRTVPDGIGARPVRYISYDDAIKYANWKKKRLPSSEEWEMAARGPNGQHFPWTDGGAENARTRSKIGGHFDDKDPTAPSEEYPSGASWCGALHMYGNVYEWTTSSKDGRQIVKGASFKTINPQEETLAEDGLGPNNNGGDEDIGFRCIWP